MLKTTILSWMLTANKVPSTKMLAANGTGNVKGGEGSKHVKLKTRRSENQKLAKFQKLSKSEKSKKPSKSRNLHNFDAIKAGPSFLTPETRITFNYLWLAFTKGPIL